MNNDAVPLLVVLPYALTLILVNLLLIFGCYLIGMSGSLSGLLVGIIDIVGVVFWAKWVTRKSAR